jgi:hypothetical protein
MSWGGKRPGAGRKPGSSNKKTRAIADRASEEGITPLEYMLAVLRDETADIHRRDDMAKAAAPYVHARLAAIELAGDDASPLVVRIERIIVRPEERAQASNGAIEKFQ